MSIPDMAPVLAILILSSLLVWQVFAFAGDRIAEHLGNALLVDDLSVGLRNAAWLNRLSRFLLIMSFMVVTATLAFGSMAVKVIGLLAGFFLVACTERLGSRLDRYLDTCRRVL